MQTTHYINSHMKFCNIIMVMDACADIFSHHTNWWPVCCVLFSARNFLNRAIIGKTLDGIVDTLDVFPCTSGFSMNLGRLSDMAVLNIEVSPDGVWITPINGYYFHFNMFVFFSCFFFNALAVNNQLFTGTSTMISHNMMTPVPSTGWRGSNSSLHPHAARTSLVS